MPVIGVVGCAAGGLEQLCDELVQPMLQQGHQVHVTLTPTADRWLRGNGDRDRIESLTGYPVRSESRLPSEDSPHPSPDAFVVAPATFNSVAKLALGIADSQALTMVSENLTTGRPIVVFPRINAAHARHPAWEGHLAALRSCGVRLIEGDDVWPLYEPRQAPPGRALPWVAIQGAVQLALSG